MKSITVSIDSDFTAHTPGADCYGIIYMAVNTVSGRAYIGLTRQSLKVRRQQHIRASRKPKSVFHKALKGNGADAFQWLTLRECGSQAELERAEVEEIEVFRGAFGRDYLYNGTNGGTGGNGINWTDERREAQRQRLMGNNLHKYMKKHPRGMLGKTHSPETIEKMRAASTGRTQSEAQRDAARKRMLGNTYMTGKKQSPDHIAKRTQSRLATMARRRAAKGQKKLF